MILLRIGKTIYPGGECYGALSEYKFKDASEITPKTLKDIKKEWEKERKRYIERYGEEVWNKRRERA